MLQDFGVCYVSGGVVLRAAAPSQFFTAAMWFSLGSCRRFACAASFHYVIGPTPQQTPAPAAPGPRSFPKTAPRPVVAPALAAPTSPRLQALRSTFQYLAVSTRPALQTPASR